MRRDCAPQIFRCLLQTSQIDSRQQQYEFFSAKTEQAIRVADRLFDQGSEIHEDSVAGIVAIFVVDLFEAIQVQHDQAVSDIGPSRRSHSDPQLLVQGAAVTGAGQWIMGGELLELTSMNFRPVSKIKANRLTQALVTTKEAICGTELKALPCKLVAAMAMTLTTAAIPA